MSKAKNLIEKLEPMFEMANIRKTTTGLPVNIWASTMPKNSKQEIKIHVSSSYSNTIDPNNTFALYFDGYNVKIEGDTNEIKDEDINKIVDFLIKHQSIFQLFGHYKIDDDELKKRLSEAKDLELEEAYSNFANVGPETHKFGVDVNLHVMQPVNKKLYSGPMIKVYKEGLDNNFVISLNKDPNKIKVIEGNVFLKKRELDILLNKIKEHRKDFLVFWNAPWMCVDELFDMLGKPKETRSSPVPTKEMPNAIKKYTGISGTVYFCTKKECKNIQAHALGSVKLISNEKSVSVSIKKDKNGKRLVSGTNRGMIRNLVKFVELNENILWKYWNMPPEEADSVETIKKFIKV